MALVLRRNILFLHIPKTGGNWLKQVLADQGVVIGSVGHKHADFSSVRVARGRRPDRWLTDRVIRGAFLSRSPRIFCVVRHPLGWYESWYRYQVSRRWPHWGTVGDLAHWHVNADLNGFESDSFRSFMRRVNEESPGYVTRLYGRYTDLSGARVLHQERLAEELVALLQGWGLDIDGARIKRAERIGVSPAIETRWDEDILAETLRNEAPALKRYGYLDAPSSHESVGIPADRIRTAPS